MGGPPAGWMVSFRTIPRSWMMTRGTPSLRNLQIACLIGYET